MKYESRISFIIPGLGEVTIAGTSRFVATLFDCVKVELQFRLADALRTFKGQLVTLYIPPEEENKDE